MTTLLVIGAGASRHLGRKVRMPLMGDWADALCASLNSREKGLATACGLFPGMDGPSFERRLGLLLRWKQMLSLAEPLQDLGVEELGGSVEGGFLDNVERRMSTVMKVVNESLYELFGQSRVDDSRAEEAYGSLLSELGTQDVIFATTNYDRCIETALTALGYKVATGFQERPLYTPRLEPVGLIENRKDDIPVLHLHGAVGWYENGGWVGEFPADQPFNSSLGVPVILYPDPEKDPTSYTVVSELWAEFNSALRIADTVLVLGHSLHDPALVRSLAQLPSSKPLLVSYFLEGPEMIKRVLPQAQPFHIRFGPQLQMKRPLNLVIKEVSSRLARAADAMPKNLDLSTSA